MSLVLAKIALQPPLTLYVMVPPSGRWMPGDYSMYNDLVSHIILRDGCWEPYETELYLEILKRFGRGEGHCIIDVGAHIGYYTLLAASLGHSVHSIEANPDTVTILKKNIELNAFSDRVQYYQGRATNLENAYIGDTTGSAGAVVIDDLDLKGDDVAILKIDVEGEEPEVIDGAKALISSGKVQSILIEISPHLRGPQAYIDTCQFLTSTGYYVVFDIGLSEPNTLKHETNHLSSLSNPITDVSSYISSLGGRQTNFLFLKRL